MVSFAVTPSPSTLCGVLSEKRKQIISYAEPRKNGSVPRRNGLQRNKPSERRESMSERNAALPVCNQEAKRKSATSAEIGKMGVRS